MSEEIESKKLIMNWRSVAELLAVVSVVLGLVFVGYELRLNRSVADSEGLANSRQISISVNQLIAENPVIWGKGCLGEELTQEERIVFLNILHAVSGQFIYQWGRSREGISTGGRAVQRAPLVMALNMHRYPGFRETWMEYTGLGSLRTPDSILGEASGEWNRAVMDQYQRLEDMPADTDVDVMFCGR